MLFLVLNGRLSTRKHFPKCRLFTAWNVSFSGRSIKRDEAQAIVRMILAGVARWLRRSWCDITSSISKSATSQSYCSSAWRLFQISVKAKAETVHKGISRGADGGVAKPKYVGWTTGRACKGGLETEPPAGSRGLWSGSQGPGSRKPLAKVWWTWCPSPDDDPKRRTIYYKCLRKCMV